MYQPSRRPEAGCKRQQSKKKQLSTFGWAAKRAALRRDEAADKCLAFAQTYFALQGSICLCWPLHFSGPRSIREMPVAFEVGSLKHVGRSGSRPLVAMWRA
jgi:hypothetical protein